MNNEAFLTHFLGPDPTQLIADITAVVLSGRNEFRFFGIMRLAPKWRNGKVDKELKMNITRRSFVGFGAMSALAGCRCPFICGDCDRSNYDGVLIGAITYSFRIAGPEARPRSIVIGFKKQQEA